MQEEDWEESGPCTDCGATVNLADPRTFRFGDTGALCWDCASKRGGEFDGALDKWGVEPGLDGLPTDDKPTP